MQSEEELENAPVYSPLSLHDSASSLKLRTMDLTRKNTTGNIKFSTIGSISLAFHYMEEPKNLFSKEPPQLPSIPDMTPAVASALWVRAWQIMKIFVDLFNMIKFAVSWEFPPLSLIVAVGYMTGVLFFSMEYLLLYLVVFVILLLCTTYVLRKKHLIAKTIQTIDVNEDSYYVRDLNWFYSSNWHPLLSIL